jgi:hypothetical protein
MRSASGAGELHRKKRRGRVRTNRERPTHLARECKQLGGGVPDVDVVEAVALLLVLAEEVAVLARYATTREPTT